MNVKQEAFLVRVLERLDQYGFTPATSADLARDLGVPPQATHAVLVLGVREERLHEVGVGVYFSLAQEVGLIEFLKREFPEQTLDPAEFREKTGLSRRLADTLLALLTDQEILDRSERPWKLNLG